MRIMGTILAIALLVIVALFAFGVFSYSCNDETGGGQPETSSSKEKNIRAYNIEQEKDLAKKRTPCDTIALQEYIIDSYPAGTYLVEFDRTYTYNIPKSAVIYYRGAQNKNYIFAVIAKSKEGERYVEKKNVIGFESSFINLDSTKLGTAFFYLTLFTCDNNNFEKLWESEAPIHGGFNSMKIKKWKKQNIMYVELNYEDGIISGHRNYNFFLIDGIEKEPHLMETYLGIVHKRTLADVNKDKFPDYYEYRFLEDSLRITELDSIPFYWSEKKQLYITDRNSRWFRKY
ncbi:MAG: hypothetical protein CVV23_14145 [Ignavibacteriae bacterium HGW-Ignavibacteriae-2]|nr:MAG: hypothetical protein CVV23_14145 [Ignavibacteriae bacterium HGW-Ignavibacteriae-2]